MRSARPRSDPRFTFVGLNWAAADERKMLASFGWAPHHFGRLEDLGRAGPGCGLGHRPGLAALADWVLGLSPPKSKQARRRRWLESGGPAAAARGRLAAHHLAERCACPPARASHAWCPRLPTSTAFVTHPSHGAQVTLSDWAAPVLSAEQIKYAALDAALVWHVHRRL